MFRRAPSNTQPEAPPSPEPCCKSAELLEYVQPRLRGTCGRLPDATHVAVGPGAFLALAGTHNGLYSAIGFFFVLRKLLVACIALVAGSDGRLKLFGGEGKH